MLLPVKHLLDRLRHPRSRADELAALRRRLVDLPEPAESPPDEVAEAQAIRRLREELTAALAGVESCGRCARGHDVPHGRWDGGHCCGGRTEGIFSDDELAALRLSGTRPEHLTPPMSDHAGCAFRGPTGCSLAVADRPTLCVRFICMELEGELSERGDLAAVRAVAGEMARRFRRLSRLRAARTAAAPPEPWVEPSETIRFR